MKNGYYRNLFIVAGIWNLAAAVICWTGIVFLPDKFGKMFSMPAPTSLFPFHAMFWMILAFGIGYIIVSRDINKNHGIVLTGMLAKVLFFIDCVLTFLLKEASIMILFTGFIDLIFAAMFLEFLLKMRRNPEHSA